ncbi:DNA repair protein REV1-like isoform X3 [Vicia villosa]|uniref:DNA repair protein REV1-like isoform X3 n=1 Tax=Vicia villosa TaxID=3911 RepID=UPI00273BF716|nr:DNA repair protein REV1-like isoform X3 [Vicia villosa]
MSLNSFRSSLAPNSKRVSSNRSNDNTNNSKRKKQKIATTTNQKTLGVAWGSNSRKPPSSDFGSYMIEKNRKLHNQFNADASTSLFNDSTSAKPIFAGVSIFVDGFTVPSSQELRSYMIKYGGRFENYFSRHRVTHIICSNLPDSKIKNLRSFSAGLPVVKPTWILDSVASNKLLTWMPYQLEQLSSNKQPKLSTFFSSRSSKNLEDTFINSLCQVEPDVEDSLASVGKLEDTFTNTLCQVELDIEDSLASVGKSNDTFTNIPCQVEPDIEDSLASVGKSEDRHSPKVGEALDSRRETSIEADDTVLENTDAIVMEEHLARVGVKCDDEDLAGGSNGAANDEKNVQGELEPNCQEPSTSVRSFCADDQNVNGFPSSASIRPSKQCHSTLTDPNFVENYFKNSRLHFIGTWRNRYRKRFPISSSGFNNEISNINASSISGNSVVIHVDMDCFFVAVVIRNHPDLLDKPVAVCHSDNSKGTSEISSANYPARSYGIKAGMFVRHARALCPHLVIFPYNFEAYEEVADQFYSILHQHCNKVQAVSCDEAYLDVTHSNVEDPELLASSIRKEIYETTGCTASVGIAGNMLMARIATRTAKPNGQYHITPERVEDHLRQLPINALPGVGHVLQEKLKKQNVQTCAQLMMISKVSLQKDYGMKTGEMLWNYSRGIDNRLVGDFQECKSIGADVNWGVRFKDMKDCENFLTNLCKEVSLRLQSSGMQGRTFSLKIKKRKKDADEPVKFMGCGDCENLSRSETIPVATDNVEVLQRIAKQLFGNFYIDVKQIRGIGLHVSRLESSETSKQGAEKYNLKSWFTPGPASMDKRKHPTGLDKKNADGPSVHECGNLPGSSVPMENNIQDNQARADVTLTTPPLDFLDMEVMKNLPPELFSEFNKVYGGKLADYITKGKGISENSSALRNSLAAIKKKEELLDVEPILQKKPLSEIEAMQHEAEGGEVVPDSVSEPSFNVTHKSSFEKEDLLPASLSQLDGSVLQELPEDLKADIVLQLPAHRKQEICSNVAVVPPSENYQVSTGVNDSENLGSKHALNECLWAGNPPKWVEEFKISSCLILKKLAEVYYKSGLTSTLSSVLHQIISEFHQLNLVHHISDDSVNITCELLKQYIKVKIGKDIEEIYICFRLLKRFAAASEFFLQVYNSVFPYLQEAVDDNYGGSLFIT